MITVLNRAELMKTSSYEKIIAVGEALDALGFEYSIKEEQKPEFMEKAMKSMFGKQARMMTIYVKKEELDQALLVMDRALGR